MPPPASRRPGHLPAVQLFVERATETLDAFELTDAEAPALADVCRRLDGITLAIEVAAGRGASTGSGDPCGLAGAPGFEPGNGGIKICCLTTGLPPIAAKGGRKAAGPSWRTRPGSTVPGSPACGSQAPSV